MSSRPDPFWLCHECSAQMRPIRIDGVLHCASCNGEFLEVLDASVNPDPYRELPPPPPTRPQPSPPNADQLPADDPGGASQAGFMQSLFGNMFGAAAMEPGSPSRQALGSPATPSGSGSGPPSGSVGARTYAFNVPGGGQGRLYLGHMGNMGGYSGGMGGFLGLGGNRSSGTAGGDQGGGLDSFFPGFPPPPHVGAGQPRPGEAMDPNEMLRSLMAAIAQDGMMPQMMMGPDGPHGQATPGDYVMTQQGFDQVLEQLMHAAGPQGPLPATDVVIDGLPRITFTEETLEKSLYKDCPVCKDEFSVGDEVMRIPCGHVCHPDCLQPWLKVNGSCPVCRFSLVPDESNRNNHPSPIPAPESSSFTNILNRLFGQSGAASGPTSPIEGMRSPGLSAMQPPQRPGSSQPPESSQHPISSQEPPRPSFPVSSQQQSSTLQNPQSSSLHGSQSTSSSPSSPSPATDQPRAGVDLSSAIPNDYRERHRRREQQEHRDPVADDLD